MFFLLILHAMLKIGVQDDSLRTQGDIFIDKLIILMVK